MRLLRFGGHVILGMILNRLSLLTKLNAFAKAVLRFGVETFCEFLLSSENDSYVRFVNNGDERHPTIVVSLAFLVLVFVDCDYLGDTHVL